MSNRSGAAIVGWLWRLAILVLAMSALAAVSGCSSDLRDHKWEYETTSFADAELAEGMNSMGDNCWEVASCRRAESSDGEGAYECIFKRPQSACQ